MKEQTVNLETINVESLPELIGWKEKQEELVKENPFIEIVDNTTFNEAKKRRTALVKGRTAIQAQDKLIASKLKDFRQKVADVSQSLIEITLEHEEKQQAEVKRYEEVKEQARLEKERIEKERVEKIKVQIEVVFEEWKTKISNFTFDEINEINIVEKLSDIDTSDFEDFVDDFNSKTRILANLFNERKDFLKLKEDQRIENERLAEERKKFEEEQKAIKEKQRIEDEERRKTIEKFQAEMKAKEIEMHAKELALEKQRIEQQKIEQARITEENKKAEAIRLEKERIAAEKEEKKRLKEIEALKPDKEKLLNVINSISLTDDVPTFKSEIAKKFYSVLKLDLEEFKNNIIVELEKL